MKDINLYSIQMADISLFLNVARYGSFTKAGEKMFVSQSWVSKRIAQMEKELELILFIRNRREVILTPAGRILEQRFQSIMDALLDAVQAAHAAQTGASGYLRIGFLEWGDVSFLKNIKQYSRMHPQYSVETYRRSFSELQEDIAVGRVDLIFTTSYDCDRFSSEEFCLRNVRRVPIVVYMNRDDPLAAMEEIDMDRLRGQPMLMVDQESSTGYGAFVTDLFARSGIRPRVGQYAHDGGEHIGSLLIGKGMLIATQSFLENTYLEEIARVPIRGEYARITAVWRKRNRNPLLEQFLSLLPEAD